MIKKIIGILIISLFFLTLFSFMLNCGSSTKSEEDITWKDAMEKYQELTVKRNDVIKLMQEKSKNR